MGFANAIIGGAAALVRAAIKSPNYAAGAAGWSINKDGSAELNNATVRGTLTAATVIGALIESATTGRRTTIDASGDIKVYNASGAVLMWFVNADDAQFFYADTGTAAQGALVASFANAAGTDPFGAAYVQGSAVYIHTGGNTYVLAAGLQNGFASFFLAGQTSAPTVPAFVGGTADGSGAEMILFSGAGPNTATASQLTLADSANSGIGNGQIQASAGQVRLGVTGSFLWNDNAQQFQLPASGGPFIANESFHAVTLGAGLTGTLRVKKLPWNAIWMDAQLAVTASGTINCGNLPDASYYPASARNIPLAPTVAGSTAYIHLPTTGAVQVITSSAAGNPGGSFTYPTN